MLFSLIIIITVALQIVFVQYAGKYLKTVPLTAKEHLICIGLGSLSLVVCFLSKIIIPPQVTCMDSTGKVGLRCDDHEGAGAMES